MKEFEMSYTIKDMPNTRFIAIILTVFTPLLKTFNNKFTVIVIIK